MLRFAVFIAGLGRVNGVTVRSDGGTNAGKPLVETSAEAKSREKITPPPRRRRVTDRQSINAVSFNLDPEPYPRIGDRVQFEDKEGLIVKTDHVRVGL